MCTISHWHERIVFLVELLLLIAKGKLQLVYTILLLPWIEYVSISQPNRTVGCGLYITLHTNLCSYTWHSVGMTKSTLYSKHDQGNSIYWKFG